MRRTGSRSSGSQHRQRRSPRLPTSTGGATYCDTGGRDHGRELRGRGSTQTGEQNPPPYSAMIAALDREIRACVEAHTERSFYQPLRRRIIGRNAELRVRLIVAQISGLMLALTPATDQIIGTTAVDELIDVYAPQLAHR